jgi:DNA anti-recombination protein RmuC
MRKKGQDDKLKDIRKGIQAIKIEAEKAGERLKEIGKKVKQNEDHIDKTGKKLETQNERVKDFINKIRSSDKICCDIVLILILIGLVCVLYSIIKHKY